VAGGVDKGQDFGHQFVVTVMGTHIGQALGKYALLAVERTEGNVQAVDGRLVETAPLQADDIQAGEPGTVG